MAAEQKHHEHHRMENGTAMPQDKALRSSNGAHRLLVQADGNLVQYQGAHPVWASNTNGQGVGPYYLSMQADNNLVLYDSKNTPLWASNTCNKGKAGGHLHLQDDRNLVVYDGDGKAIWAHDRVEIAPSDRLTSGKALPQDNSLRSQNGAHQLLVQADGNLVQYQGAHPVWASNTNGQGVGPYYVSMQADNNLVLYDSKNTPLWASNTCNKGKPGAHVVMQDDRNLVIYDGDGKGIWANDKMEVPASDRLASGHILRQDVWMKSHNGAYSLIVQADGNLVEYHGSEAVWASGTDHKGHGPYYLAMQADNNLVLYDSHNTPLWASNTCNHGKAGAHLILQDDRNLVVYDGESKPVWANNKCIN